MKKTTILIVLLSAVLVLSSCITVNINGGDQTSGAITTAGQTTGTQTAEDVTSSEQTTGEQTSEEVTTEELIDTIPEFFAGYSGYWTNKDGKFIFIGEDEGKYRVSFGVWNAGGPFPAGDAQSIEAKDKTSFKLRVLIDALPDDPEWYGEGYDAYYYDLSLADVSADGERKITTKYIGETEVSTFYYHTEPENPFLGQ